MAFVPRPQACRVDGDEVIVLQAGVLEYAHAFEPLHHPLRQAFQIPRRELLQIIVERVSMHQIGRICFGQTVQILKQALLGCGGVLTGFVVKLPTRPQTAHKKTEPRPDAKFLHIYNLPGATKLEKITDPAVEAGKKVPDSFRQRIPQQRQRFYCGAFTRAAARCERTYWRMICRD